MLKRAIPRMLDAVLDLVLRAIPLLMICAIVGGAIWVTVYSFKRCGWGMFAYEYPLIAALTQECAQQQRLLN